MPDTLTEIRARAKRNAVTEDYLLRNDRDWLLAHIDALTEAVRDVLPILDVMVERQTLTGAVRARDKLRAILGSE